MQRGTREFAEIIKEFEKRVDTGLLGYIPSDFEKHNAGDKTFYANGTVDMAFKCFIHGYAMARCEYMN